MQKRQQWESASDADWSLAVEREAVIRPLAEQQRLCTEDVEEASRHLQIACSFLYSWCAATGSVQRLHRFFHGRGDEIPTPPSWTRPASICWTLASGNSRSEEHT